MNILITGSFGFVGSNLSLSIKNKINCKLFALDISEPENHLYEEVYSWNNLDSLQNIDFDVIIHLAGKAHDTRNISDSSSYFEINTELTQKIYDYFLKSSSKKFIFFSSVKAAADNIFDIILKEDVIPKPKTPYGISKLLAEKYILKKLKPEKNIYILRPCMIHGSGNKGNFNLLFNIIKNRVPWPLGLFDNKRSFCSIDNVCFVINELIFQKPVPSGIYNLSDDKPISTNDLVKLISHTLKIKVRIWNIPIKLVKLISKMGDYISLPLNSERLNKLSESYVVSNKKIKKALALEKMPFTTQEGLIKTIKSLKNASKF